MSKMSQLAMELDELAVEKGFQDYQEAHAHGYTFTTDDKDQIILTLTYAGELEAAHNALLKEREKILGELISIYNDIDVPKDYKQHIKHAIDFIKQEVK